MASEENPFLGFIIAECSFAIMALLAISIGSYQSVKHIKSLKEKGEPPEMPPLSVKEALKLPFYMGLILSWLYLSIKLDQMENQDKANSNSEGDFLIPMMFFWALVPNLSELIRPVISFLISPIHIDVPYHLFFKKGRGDEEKYLIDKHFTSHGVISSLCWCLLALWYLLTKSWIINNIIGFGASVVVIKILHLNKMMTGCILLTALLIYDVFFVFGTDFMVTVAVSLDMPAKLMFPRDIVNRGIHDDRFAMLGVGDIAIPGAMTAFLLRFDLSLERNSCFYFFTSLMCYSFGFLMTIVVLHFTRSGQPALLYLVPFSLIPLLVTAFIRGDGTKLFSFEDYPEVEEDQRNEKEEEPIDSSHSLSPPQEINDPKKDD